jgi:GNAT superfamily N-acetyltransferase
VILGPKLADGSAEIVALFVDRDHRRKGIGGDLMAWAHVRARVMGANALFLYSNPTESSVEFYLRSGFAITGLISSEIVPGLPGDIVMAKRLEGE